MPEPKDRKTEEAGYQPQKKPNEERIQGGYQPNKKPTEDQLNPPSGGSNADRSDSQTGNNDD